MLDCGGDVQNEQRRQSISDILVDHLKLLRQSDGDALAINHPVNGSANIRTYIPTRVTRDTIRSQACGESGEDGPAGAIQRHTKRRHARTKTTKPNDLWIWVSSNLSNPTSSFVI